MNNLELEILNLYDSIILIDEPENSPTNESKKVESSEQKLKFHGGINKKLLFVYNLLNKWQNEDEQMITNLITNALKFQLSDVTILNLAENKNVALQRIIEELNPAQIIFWDCVEYPTANGLNTSQYEVHSHQNFRYINVDAVNSFHANKDLKTKLWQSIQTLLK